VLPRNLSSIRTRVPFSLSSKVVHLHDYVAQKLKGLGDFVKAAAILSRIGWIDRRSPIGSKTSSVFWVSVASVCRAIVEDAVKYPSGIMLATLWKRNRSAVFDGVRGKLV